MPDTDEEKLLQDYVASRSEAAFRQLVERHVDMVFGCALRRAGDAGVAEEVSQTVFTILARKAHRLEAGAGLAGWLYTTTLYESSKALRGESRRRRKMKALAEHALTQNESEASGDDVLPLVDEAIAELPDGDRHLILLHYFEGRSFREISRLIGKSEAASQKQASRALEKLGKFLRRRGVVACASALGSILAAESAKTAPAGIATAISGSAVAGASALTTSTLITNAIQTMTYAKTKIAIAVAATAAVPIGVQWNSIGNLKDDLRVHEQREEEFVQRGERIVALEQKLAKLEGAVVAADPGGEVFAASKRAEDSLTALVKRPGPAGGLAQGREIGVGSGASASAAEPEASPPGAGDKSPGEAYAEMFKDPAMRSMMKKQMEAQIAVSYGDFFDHLGIEGDRRRELTDLLLERQMSLAVLQIENMQGPGNSAAGEITAASNDYEAKVRELVGEASYGEFTRFERSAAERQELATFRGALEARGAELPFETEQRLMDIMYDVRMNHQPSSVKPTAESFGPGGVTGEALESFLKDYRERQEKVRERVGGVLNGEQLEAFTQNQASHLRLIETSMEMQAKIWLKDE